MTVRRGLPLAAVLLTCIMGSHAQQQCITPYQSCLNNVDLSYVAQALEVTACLRSPVLRFKL